MATRNGNDVQTKIINHAKALFDLRWSQATSDETINFNVSTEDMSDLKVFMSSHDYELWVKYREDEDEVDLSFIEE